MIEQEVKKVILEPITMVPQMDGWGKSIESIILSLNMSKVLDTTKAEQFLLELEMTTPEATYKVSGVHKMTEIGENGMLSLGMGYVLEPFDASKLTYKLTIQYLYD